MRFFEVTVNGRLLGYVEGRSQSHARRIARATFPDYAALRVQEVC